MFRTGKRHRLTSEAGKRNERGVDPTICEAAADRVRRAAVDVRRRHASRPASPSSARPPAAADDRASPIDLPGAGRRACRSPARHVVAHLRGDRLRGRAGDDALDASSRRRGGPTSTTPTTSSRRSSGSSATTRCRRCCRPPPAGRGLTREQRLRRRIGRTLAGAGCVEVVSFPFVGRRRPSTRSGCPTTTCCGTPYAWPTRCRPRSRSTPPRCCPVCCDAAARNLGRGAAGVALFETGTVAFPVDRGPAPVYGVDWRPDRGRAGQAVRRAARAAAVPGGGAERRARAAPAGGARAAPPTGPTPSSVVRAVGRGARRGGPGRVGRADARGTRAAVPGCSSATQELGHAGELHPRVCAAFGLPRGTAALEIDLDFLMSRAVDVPRAPTYSNQPVAKEDVALVVDDAVAGRGGRGGAAGGGRRPAGVGPAVRRLHRPAGRRGPQVAGLRAALPRSRPHPDRGRDRRRPRRRGRRRGRSGRRRPALTRRKAALRSRRVGANRHARFAPSRHLTTRRPRVAVASGG